MLPHRHKFLLMAVAPLLFSGAASARTITIPFSASNFSDPLDIDNSFYPLVPGTTQTYMAETKDGCEVDVVTVTNDTRVIAGVTTRVVRDTAYEGETCTTDPSALVEDTPDYFAQDNAGNVWYFGEDTFDCEIFTCPAGGGSWLAGVNGALPGIIMLASPQSGDRYRQEVAEGVAEDWGMVMNLNASVRLQRDNAFPPGEFDGCIVTKEWNGLEPGSVEHKTYCPDIGLVLVEEHSGKLVRFELVTTASDALRFRTVPRQ